MKILIWNVKGGVGKTSLSLNLSLRFGHLVLTNDEHSRIDKIIGNKAKILSGTDYIPATPAEIDVIYDMGGKAEARIIEAAKMADVIMVPVIMDTVLDLQATITSIASLQKHNPRILIVANKTKRGHITAVEKAMSKHFNHPVIEIKQSNAFKNALHSKKSIAKLRQESALANYHYRKPAEQLEDLMVALTAIGTQQEERAA